MHMPYMGVFHSLFATTKEGYCSLCTVRDHLTSLAHAHTFHLHAPLQNVLLPVHCDVRRLCLDHVSRMLVLLQTVAVLRTPTYQGRPRRWSGRFWCSSIYMYKYYSIKGEGKSHF